MIKATDVSLEVGKSTTRLHVGRLYQITEDEIVILNDFGLFLGFDYSGRMTDPFGKQIYGSNIVTLEVPHDIKDFQAGRRLWYSVEYVDWYKLGKTYDEVLDYDLNAHAEPVPTKTYTMKARITATSKGTPSLPSVDGFDDEDLE